MSGAGNINWHVSPGDVLELQELRIENRELKEQVEKLTKKVKELETKNKYLNEVCMNEQNLRYK